MKCQYCKQEQKLISTIKGTCSAYLWLKDMTDAKLDVNYYDNVEAYKEILNMIIEYENKQCESKR